MAASTCSHSVPLWPEHTCKMTKIAVKICQFNLHMSKRAVKTLCLIDLVSWQSLFNITVLPNYLVCTFEDRVWAEILCKKTNGFSFLEGQTGAQCTTNHRRLDIYICFNILLFNQICKSLKKFIMELLRRALLLLYIVKLVTSTYNSFGKTFPVTDRRTRRT